MRRERMRVGPFAALIWLASACTSAPSAMHAPELSGEPEPEPPATEVIPERAPAEAASRAAVSMAEIGMARAPEIGAEARKENSRALKLHRAGDYAGARVGFAKAVELSPDHDMARYNLACAQARLGDVDAARDELSTLLHRDLLRFQERWRGPKADADLEALRTSKHAAELDALIDGLRDAYDAAHDRGIPSYLYRFEELNEILGSDDMPRQVGGTFDLVAGAWVHEAKRFVPLAREGNVALLDLPRRRMIRAHTGIEIRHCYNAPLPPTIDWVSTDPDPGKHVAASLVVNAELVGAGPLDPADDFIVGWSVGFAGDAIGVNVEWQDGARTRKSFLALTADGAVTKRDARIEFDGAWIRQLREGAQLNVAAPAGYAITKRKLTVPGRPDAIELDRAYEAVFVAGDSTFVLGRRFRTGADFSAINDTTVARIDAGAGKATRVAQGANAGWLVVGPDGAVYIDTGGKTQRWATPDASSAEATMDGLHLAMPLDDPFCECCG